MGLLIKTNGSTAPLHRQRDQLQLWMLQKKIDAKDLVQLVCQRKPEKTQTNQGKHEKTIKAATLCQLTPDSKFVPRREKISKRKKEKEKDKEETTRRQKQDEQG